MPGVVAADQVAEFATGLPTLFVKGTAVLGCESEGRRPWSAREWTADMGIVCVKKWGVHGLISFLER